VGPAPEYALTNTTAGILAGDRLAAEFHLLDGVRLRLAAPAATRVHTMAPGQSAGQSITFHLAAGAALTYWPHQLIPYAGADYRQETVFRLDPAASLVAGELLTPGRTAFGEAFAYSALRLRTHIYLGPSLVLADRPLLRPGAEGGLGRPGMLAGYSHLGSLYLAGAAAATADLEGLADLLAELPPGVAAGISRPHPGLIVARVLGTDAEAVATILERLAPGLVRA
jgi:urease accessory protein